MTPKRRGRPPLDPDAPSVRVHVRFTTKHYDALCTRASARRETLSETIRRALTSKPRPNG